MIFGWDISTSVIGITVLDNDGNFVESSFIDLRKIEGGWMEKAEVAKKEVWAFLAKHQTDDPNGIHYVEDRLGNFSAGKSMLQVLMLLASFNAVISFVIKNTYGTKSITHIHPSTVKSIMKNEGLIIPKGADKKALTLAFAQQKEPSFPVHKNKNDNPQPYCYDMADSYIVAKAGFIKSNETRTETSSVESGTKRRRKKEG